MLFLKIAGFSAIALAAGLAAAGATSLKDVKDQGYIRIATANEVPYSYMKDDGTSAGIGPDVANAVLKKLGIAEANWSVTPFGTLIPGLKAKRFDFVAAEQNISPERCKQVSFTEPNSSYGEGLLVKKGTSADIIKRYTEAAKVAHADPEVRSKLEAQGFDVVAETGPQLLPNIKEQIARWGKLVERSGFSAEDRGSTR